MARSPSDKSRGGRRRSPSNRRATKGRKEAARRSRSRSVQARHSSRSPPAEKRGRRKRSPSPVKKRSPSRSPSRPRGGRGRQQQSRSRSRSRRPVKQRPRSRSLERVPPVDFGDYEPSPDGGGWYVYKKTGKWKFHPETGLYLHVKSKVYYVANGDSKVFRKIEDEDDPVIRKMKQSEEMRKAIQATDFVKFGDEGGVEEEGPGEEGVAPAPRVPGPEMKAPEPEVEVDKMTIGKVQKWDSEKGFGFITAEGQEDKEAAAAKGIFCHRKNVVGSTPSNPINLREGGKVQFMAGEADGRVCALEVMMLDHAGKPLSIHLGAQNLEEKKKSYYVNADALGLRVHAESWPGLKKTLQDRYVSDEHMEELGVYFGVFDGHGGTQVADYCAKQLHKNIMAHFRSKQVQPASRDEKIKGAIKEAFMQTDKEILLTSERKKFEQVGSTAVTAILHGNPKLGTALRLVVANLGDSRGVLCRAGQAVAISEDHKPSRIDEKKRIERAGGLVLQVRGTWRVAASTGGGNTKAARREYQGLAMTRTFGDMHFKKPVALAISEPDIQIIPLSDKDLFMVLATDGIFDVLPNQEVVDLAIKHWDSPDEAAKNIVRTAYKRGSEDNLTVLVIQFGWADKNAPKYAASNASKGRSSAADPDNGGITRMGGASMKAESAVDDGMDMFG